MRDPNEDPLDDGIDKDQLPEPDQEERTRTLIPRTAITARAWLEARAEAERILAAEQIAFARAHIRATLERWRVEAETSGIPFRSC